MRRYFRIAGCAVALATAAVTGYCAPVSTYFGQDLNAGSMPSSFTHTLTARDAFLLDAGTTLTEGFESLVTGDGFAVGDRAPFVSSLGARIGVDNAIAEAWHFSIGGRYPLAGENYLLFVGKPSQVSALIVDFSDPVRTFGFHASDVGDFAEKLGVRLLLSDGSTAVIDLPHRIDDLAANASSLFFGVRSGTPIVRATIENQALSEGTPYIAFDDFMVSAQAQPGLLPGIPAVPEPSGAALFCTGILGMYPVLRRLRRSRVQQCLIIRAADRPRPHPQDDRKPHP